LVARVLLLLVADLLSEDHLNQTEVSLDDHNIQSFLNRFISILHLHIPHSVDLVQSLHSPLEDLHDVHGLRYGISCCLDRDALSF